MSKYSESIRQELGVAIYFLRLANKISKSYIPLTIVSSIFPALTLYMNMMMPKLIIDELMDSKRIHLIAIYVGVTIFGNLIISLLSRYFETKLDLANSSLLDGIEMHLGKHMMNMDFESLEDPKILDLRERALAPIKQQGAITKMISSIRAIVQNTISLLGLIAIISTLNALLIAVILVIVWINAFIFKNSQKAQFNYHHMLTPINRKFGYYSKLSSDFSMAKDVRMYNMAPYILEKMTAYHKESTDGFGVLFRIIGIYKGLSNINVQIQMLVIYIFMVYKVYTRSISIGSFTMYIAAANNFSNNVSSLLNAFIEFRQMCKYLDLFRKFERIPTKSTTGDNKVANLLHASIEFRNVYFRYPGSEEYTLINVSIQIQHGEKLSIVGKNGAGKSTFIKLLCRLYDPEKGEILLNGVNIKDYAYSEYTKLLSVVFQDYKLFQFSIKENIVFDQNNSDSDSRVIQALEQAGLFAKVTTLERGMDTVVNRVLEKAGVELSGGEAQKLAIARAIYKNTPIVVLDEPTAALDPYAEYDMYSKFNEIALNKTAIYISHRLSSCKFCDRIAVFDNGEIVEYGHHDELIRIGKIYSLMWTTQAEYYMNA